MGLSMWHIYSELHVGVKTALIQEGKPSIVNARLVVDTDNEPESVLVGEGSDFFHSNVDVVIAHGHDMILVRDSELNEVFNEVCEILDRYREWENELVAAQNCEDGLQKLLDCSFPVIHHAVFIYGRDGRALAISSHFPPETHWLWEEVLSAPGLTASRMQSLKKDIKLTKVFQDAKPTIRKSSIDESYEYMHCSLRLNGLVVGHLVLFSFDHPFEQGLDQLVMKLVKHCEAHMLEHAERYALKSDEEQLVSSMLLDEQYPASALFAFMKERKWHLDDMYRVHVLCEGVEGETVIVTRAYLLLLQRLNNAIVVRHEKNLMVLENESSANGRTTFRSVFERESMLKSNFKCGTSAPFRSLIQCNEYCQQAFEELKCAQKLGNQRSCADDHAVDHFLRLLEGDALAKTYVRSDLRTLKAFDRVHGTAYYETLRAYCLSGFHATHTARLLKIHRNSLLYRLNRIRELIDFEPYDALAAQPNVVLFGEVIGSFIIIDTIEYDW